MTYQLERLTGPDGLPVLTAGELDRRIGQLIEGDGPRLRRLWAYYRNTMRPAADPAGGDSARPYRQAQEWGLPTRITGVRAGREVFSAAEVNGLARKEVVIENDIGWRIESGIDYLFGKSVVIRSAAPDEARRGVIDRLIEAILAHNGGVQFFQRLALLGAVYGFVDVLVKLSVEGAAGKNAEASALSAESGSPPAEPCQEGAAPRFDDLQTGTGASTHSHEARIQRIARMVRLEIVEPARALPVLCPTDYRVVQAYVQRYELPRPRPVRRRPAEPRRWWERWLCAAEERLVGGRAESMEVVEIITPDGWQRYEDRALAAEGTNSLGQVPLVHIQNTSMPFEYAGMSEVETLIPLQDELNTRLSDRASRITLQSFRMYLGKGVEGFDKMPIGPGRMWTTQDPAANVIEFGGDADCPSESLHIADLREAMDKTSGVSPIAAGAIKNRIGRLTSAAALRLTLISLLAKTDKKRTTYGQGIERMIDLSLAWLDRAGVFATAPEERLIELHWPSPLPENDVEKLQEAEIKARLGVPREVVLRELGY